MQLKRFIVFSATLSGLACGDSTGLEVEDLQGTWNATTYVFVNDANSSETVDIIAGQGASFVMTVVANGTVNTVLDDGQGGTSSDSGTLNGDGTSLTLAGDVFTASRSGDNLTLVDSSAEYDFDNDGSDDPATLRIELERQ